MTDDLELDVEALREQLAEARAEVDRLSSAAADREARARQLEETVTALRRQLAAEEERARAGEQAAESTRRELDDARGKLAAAAARYRDLALRAAPELPPDLVAGETIDEVDASLERARETVARVRSQLEAQSKSGRVPVGAPPRTGVDVSGLSPREKISHGLRRSGG